MRGGRRGLPGRRPLCGGAAAYLLIEPPGGVTSGFCPSRFSRRTAACPTACQSSRACSGEGMDLRDGCCPKCAPALEVWDIPEPEDVPRPVPQATLTSSTARSGPDRPAVWLASSVHAPRVPSATVTGIACPSGVCTCSCVPRSSRGCDRATASRGTCCIASSRRGP